MVGNWMGLSLMAAGAPPGGGRAPVPPTIATPMPGMAADTSAAGSAPPPAGSSPPAPPAKKKGKAGVIIGLVVALVLLAGGAAAAYFFLFAAPGPKLAKYAPKDVEVYVEVPSVPKALVAFIGMDAIDDTKLKADDQLERVTKGMAKAFKLDGADARGIFESVDAFSFVVRDATRDSEAAFLVSFSSDEALTKLFDSKRFDKDGSFGQSGVKYEVEAKELDAEDFDEMDRYELAFSSVDVQGDAQALVWFPDQKVLVLGTDDLVEDIADVIEKGKESFADGELMAGAQFESGSSVLTVVDPALLDDLDDEIRDGYFKDVGPFSGSVKFVDAGVMVSVIGQAAGEKMPDDSKLTDAVTLDLPQRLPADTLAYAAFSSKSELTGEEAETAIIKSVREGDKEAGKELEKMLDDLKDEYGVNLATVYDATGDQGVVAVTVSKKYKLDLEELDPEDATKHVAVAYLQHLQDKDAAQKLVKELRTEVVDKLLGDKYEIDKKGDGFVAKPQEDELPTIRVEFIEDHLVVAAGKKKRADAIFKAFEGQASTLAEDAAHGKAVAAFGGKPHFLLWVDTGRMGDAWLKQLDKDVKKELKKQKIPYQALVLSGDDRMTSALALRVSADEGVWTYQVDALNTLSASALGGFAAQTMRGTPDFDADIGSDVAFEVDTGASECDTNVEWLRDCAARIKDDDLMSRAKVMQKAYIEKVDEDGVSTANAFCKDIRVIVKSNDKCQ